MGRTSLQPTATAQTTIRKTWKRILSTQPSLSVIGGSGPGAGGAPEGGEGADGGAASGAVNNCDERTSLGAGKQSLTLLQSIFVFVRPFPS